jgi:hypothetical protein
MVSCSGLVLPLGHHTRQAERDPMQPLGSQELAQGAAMRTGCARRRSRLSSMFIETVARSVGQRIRRHCAIVGVR